jgi:hypothetical protein
LVDFHPFENNLVSKIKFDDMDQKAKKSSFAGRLFKRKPAVLSTTSPAAAIAAGSVGASADLLGSENSAASFRNLQQASETLERYLREMDREGESLQPELTLRSSGSDFWKRWKRGRRTLCR